MIARAQTSILLLLFILATFFSVRVSAETISEPLSAEQRWDILRSVMSKPGVMLDMANLTDNGYVWENDVLWEGEALPTNEKWYTAGLFFSRAGYKGVWLQYTFQYDEASGALGEFRRSFGTGAFR